MSETKIGRPEKIRGGGKRTLVIRLSASQMEWVECAAKRQNKAKSEWARDVLEAQSKIEMKTFRRANVTREGV